MKDENKALIELKKESLFSRVVSFFKSIFFRKRNVQKNESDQIENFDIESKSVEEKEFIDVEKTNSGDLHIKNNMESAKLENEKEQFFKLYNDFKSKKLKFGDVDLYDMIRISKLLEEEREIYIKKN